MYVNSDLGLVDAIRAAPTLDLDRLLSEFSQQTGIVSSGISNVAISLDGSPPVFKLTSAT
jgi:hypothetical protein